MQLLHRGWGCEFHFRLLYSFLLPVVDKIKQKEVSILGEVLKSWTACFAMSNMHQILFCKYFFCFLN